jgi:hypothetical protein
MASYGKPPLGAILLRLEGDLLTVIGRSADNAVKTLDIQNHDIVAVGPLERISALELGTLELNPLDAPSVVAKTIYGNPSSKRFALLPPFRLTRLHTSGKSQPKLASNVSSSKQATTLRSNHPQAHNLSNETTLMQVVSQRSWAL